MLVSEIEKSLSMTESKTFISDVFIYFPYDIDKKLEGRALSSPIIGKKDRPGTVSTILRNFTQIKRY